MPLRDILQPEDILLGLQPQDKWDCIDHMLKHLVARERIQGELVQEANEAVLNRERSMSTGMERGIAIPHAAIEGLEEVVFCLGVVPAKGGLNFESIDASPTHFVALLLIPRAQKLLHIRTLADVARVLGEEAVRSALLHAGGVGEAWQAVCGEA